MNAYVIAAIWIGLAVVLVMAVLPLVRLFVATRAQRRSVRILTQLQADWRAKREEDMARRRAELDVIARGDSIHQRFR